MQAATVRQVCCCLAILQDAAPALTRLTGKKRADTLGEDKSKSKGSHPCGKAIVTGAGVTLYELHKLYR
jgi:hypothetical protein